MDTKKLEALAAAVEYGSFTRAAENLGYTQSGLTHMMNSLEKDIGFPVLLRGRQGVRLTPAGERIFPLIRNLLDADEALGREIGRINTNREETVRIAAYSSIAIHWLPEDIRFGIESYYGGLHCGDCFDVKVRDVWIPVRIEMDENWYLVGLSKTRLGGLTVRM